jgi:homoserine O-acetyltransferase
VWREMGYSSLEDFLIGFWEGFFLDRRDPNNLLNMLWTWQNSNIGLTDGCDGSVEKALGLIRAKAIVMPAAQDLYFPVADEEYEVKFMQNAELRVIPGVWGQFEGAGLNSHDTKFIDKAVHDLLAM